jgi:hypothetical protein
MSCVHTQNAKYWYIFDGVGMEKKIGVFGRQLVVLSSFWYIL